MMIMMPAGACYGVLFTTLFPASPKFLVRRVGTGQTNTLSYPSRLSFDIFSRSLLLVPAACARTVSVRPVEWLADDGLCVADWLEGAGSAANANWPREGQSQGEGEALDSNDS
jgi:hypothetical protein